jgi:hypothetical protein
MGMQGLSEPVLLLCALYRPGDTAERPELVSKGSDAKAPARTGGGGYIGQLVPRAIHIGDDHEYHLIYHREALLTLRNSDKKFPNQEKKQ